MTKPERLELAYGLHDAVLHDAAAPDLSDAQRQELRERLAHHRANPDEPGVTLDDIRRKLIGEALRLSGRDDDIAEVAA